MKNIKLLDCTLRDGGYINDWDFGHSNLISVSERIAESGTDILEVGFLDERRPFDSNRSIFPNTKAMRATYEMLKKRPPMLVGMIDYGTCGLQNLEPAESSILDGIRVIFKKQRMQEAMEYCREVKKLGYKVFSQLVSITSYSEEELLNISELVNDVKPYAVSMVDTYGLLHPADLIRTFEILEKNVRKEIGIGFHAHNNLQLAYANSIAFADKAMEQSKDDSRIYIVDGTLYGMGKSAGNAPIELLGRYLNTIGGNYNIHPMLEAIEESIKGIYIKSPWGYKTSFYLSAENRCHPSYITYFQNKGNLSVSKMDELLSRIEPEDKKLLYDSEVAEQIYQDYLKEKLQDEPEIAKLAKLLQGDRPILLLGPGKNISLQAEKVKNFIQEKQPVTISINYIPRQHRTDYVFVTKVDRYQQMTDSLHRAENRDMGIICTTNVECKGFSGYVDEDDRVIVVNREPLLELKEEICDNSFLMLLKILRKAGISKVYLAGLDGYSDKEDNYFEPGMEYSFIKSAASRLNYQIRQKLANEFSDIRLDFITYSHYSEVEDVNSGAF